MIHLFHSENCTLRGLDTYAHGHNNDGVDVEMTRDVLIENCRFDQSDDGVVLKAGRNADAWRLHRPTERVVVRNCRYVFALAKDFIFINRLVCSRYHYAKFCLHGFDANKTW